MHGRFVAGSGIGSANLQRACIELTWEDQQAEFAKFVLFNLFAIYEGWLALTLAEIGFASLEKPLQFPTTIARDGSVRGVSSAFAQLQRNASITMKDAFYSDLSTHPKKSLPKLKIS